jgi:hypothetical protein
MLIPGDYIYMKNKDDYGDEAKAHGTAVRLWNGENCIFNGYENSVATYSGLGLRHQSKDQMAADLRAGYVTDTGHDMSDLGFTNEVIFVVNSHRYIAIN